MRSRLAFPLPHPAGRTKDSDTMSRRVAVTGLGAVTPLGSGAARFWDRLCAGQSGVGPITLFDAGAFPVRIAGEVTEFTLPAEIDRRRARRLDRYALFGVGAALQAWQDAGIEAHDPYDSGIVLGSSHGGENTALQAAAALGPIPGRKAASPLLIPRMLSNMAAAQAAMLLDLRGPGFALSSACATGGHALGEASEIIRRGDAEVMVAGAAEACITPLTLAGDHALGALSRRNAEPQRACRPFDRDRDGFVLAEGAAVLVLEELDHARRRGARVYAELSGYGATTDGVHETRPEPNGAAAAKAISRALEKAGTGPREVSAIFAHAAGTRAGDEAEVRALGASLGEALGPVPVTAIKSMTGHMLAASGAAQAVAAAKAVESGSVPPTINCESIDEMGISCVRGEVLRRPLARVLSNSFGFGGHNAVLLFSAPAP